MQHQKKKRSPVPIPAAQAKPEPTRTRHLFLFLAYTINPSPQPNPAPLFAVQVSILLLPQFLSSPSHDTHIVLLERYRPALPVLCLGPFISSSIVSLSLLPSPDPQPESQSVSLLVQHVFWEILHSRAAPTRPAGVGAASGSDEQRSTGFTATLVKTTASLCCVLLHRPRAANGLFEITCHGVKTSRGGGTRRLVRLWVSFTIEAEGQLQQSDRLRVL